MSKELDAEVVSVLPDIGIGHRLNRKRSYKGYAAREAIIQLRCSTNMTMAEISEQVGRTTRHCEQVWSTALREARQAKIDPEKKEELAAWMLYQVKMVITKAQARVEDHAAYGALVLKGVENLSEMIGVGKNEVVDDKFDLEEIAERVQTRSPLVMAKLNKVKDEASADRIAKELK